ncbi:MAG: hypothetical protein RDU20_15090 [Desulfomonilaceae bacterium]|nr:hypothetical protein [Desulfomonilaceae bacterium]
MTEAHGVGYAQNKQNSDLSAKMTMDVPCFWPLGTFGVFLGHTGTEKRIDYD